MGPEIAEHLGLPHVTNVTSILKEKDGRLTVRCMQDGLIVTQTVRTPCLLCVDGAVNTPRLPSYRRKKQFVGQTIEFLSLAEMQDRDEQHYGLSGSPTQVVRIFPPEKNDTKEMWKDKEPVLAQKLFDLLKSRKAL